MPDKPSSPRTAVQTTKYTKHTKDERLTKRTRLTRRGDILAAPNLRRIICFVYFVYSWLRLHLGQLDLRRFIPTIILDRNSQV